VIQTNPRIEVKCAPSYIIPMLPELISQSRNNHLQEKLSLLIRVIAELQLAGTKSNRVFSRNPRVVTSLETNNLSLE